ncbi:MAG: TIGR03790 family protein [Planctomycetota bacterium]
MNRSRASLSVLVLALALGCFAAPSPLMAGGGGENMLLVVNPNDPASLQIANAYAALRNIPANNILFIAPPTDYHNDGLPISQAEVTNTYLTPISVAISARGLTNQIDYIGTIGQAVEFPVSGVSLTTQISLNYALTLLTPLTNGSGLTMNTSPLVSGSTGLYESPSSIPVGSNLAIHHSATYSSYFPYASASYSTQYYMSGTIGYTGTNGNTVGEVIASLQSAAASDGTRPAGAIYFEDNGDIRSTTRHGQWPATESQLTARNIPWVYESNTSGATPQNRSDVLGAVCGLATMNLPNGSTYLPGSWADDLTSYGCTFYDYGQTKSTKFIAAGAAGTTGSVAEPYAISQRFTNSSLYTFMADGSTLGECFAKSVAAPDIQMPLGDMLAQPYADVPKVSITSGPGNYGFAKGTISISASAGLTNPHIATGINSLELLIDGLISSFVSGGSGTFNFNTSTLSDGVHEVRIVGINNSQAASEGYAAQQIVVNNHGRAINFNGGNLTLTSSAATISLAATAGDGTVSHVELTCLGRVVAQAGGSPGSLSLSRSSLAPGDNVIVPVAVFGDGMQVAGGAFVVHVASGAVNGWGNSAGNGLWSRPLNWTSGSLPQNNDGVARFSGAAHGGTVMLDISATVEEIALDNSGGGDYTIAASPGQTLTLSSTNGSASQCLVNVLSGNHTISAPLALATGGNLFAVANPADSLAVSGNVSGNGSVTKTGAGTLTLSGSNAYTGNALVAAGVLAISGANALPGTSVVTVQPGGNLSVADSTARTTPVAGLTLAGPATVTLDWNGGNADQITTNATATTSGKLGISLNPTNAPSGGPFTLIQAAGGLDSGTYYLANNTNYTATLTVSSTAVQVGSYAAQVALTTAYWYGGLVSGAGSAMALSASDGSTSNWSSTAGSYTTTALVPGPTTDVILSATGASQQGKIVLGANMSVNSLTFNDTTPVTIANDGFAISLNSTGSGASSAISANQSAAVNAGIALGGAAVFTTAGGKTLTIGGAISGGSLTVAGSGTTVLSGTNSFAGGVTICSPSTLKLGAAEVIPSGPSKGNVIINGTLDLNGNSDTINGLSGSGRVDNSTGAGTYTFSVGGNDATTTFSGSIQNTSGFVALSKIGAGTLTLSGTNSYAGPTQVLAGTLALGSSSALPAASPITVNGGTLDLGAFRSTAASLILQNGTVTGSNGVLTASFFSLQNGVVSVPLAGPGALSKSTMGTVVLSGSNTYSGGTVLSGGTLAASADSSLGASGGTLTFDGGTLQVLTNQFNSLSRPVQWNSAGGTLWIDDPANTFVLFAQNLLGNGPLVKAGPGSLQLVGSTTNINIAVRDGLLLLSGSASQFTGNPVVSLSNTAVLSLNNHNETISGLNLSGGTINGGTGTLTLNGIVNYLPSTWPTTITGNLALGPAGGTFQIDPSVSPVTIGQSLSGNPASGLVKTGGGTLILFGTNSYAGPTQVLAGTLALGSSSALPAASPITVNGGTLDLGAFRSTAASLILQNGTVTGSNGVLTASFFSLQNGVVSVPLAGPGALSKSTTGTVVLSGSNTYSGGTLLSAGTLQIGLGGVTGTLGLDMAPVIDNGTLVFNRAGTLSVTSPISGTGSVIQAGPGTTLLSGSNTYSGPTTISAGILQLGAAGAIPSGAGMGNVAVNGTLDLNGNSPTVNSLSGSGTVDNLAVAGACTLAVGANGATSTFSGSIKNTSGLVAMAKTGAGMLTLSGSNSYSGSTFVTAGTLLISGTSALPSTGTVSVQSGGNLSLADSTASHTPVAGLTLAGPATVTLDWIGGNADQIITSADQITTNATATTSGRVGISLNLTNTPSGGPFTLIQAAGGLDNATYYLANNTNYSATLTLSSTAVQVASYSSQVRLLNAYWFGGRVPGAQNAMALSNGTASNWSSTAGTGAAVRLTVPGSMAAVFFSATGATQQNNIVLGANMSVSRLTFNDTAPITIANDGCAITLNSPGTGTTSAVSANQNATINAGVVLGGANVLTTASGKTLTVGGAISGTGGLTLAGSGTTILSGNNSYTGTTTLSGGTLSTASIGYGSNAGNLGAASNAAGNLVFNGGVLRYTAAGEITDRGFTINAGQVATLNISNPAANLTFTGSSVATTGGLAITGPGQLTLAGTYGFTGATTVSGGTLSIGNGGSGASIATSGVALSNNANLTFNHSDPIIFSKAITGTGSLTKTGGGTLSLTTSQNYTGATTINGGVLKLQGGPLLTVTNGLSLWLDAGGFQTAGLLGTWPDQSGNGRNLTQSNAANQPSVVLNAINGLPVVQFNGNGVLGNATNFGNNYTIFSVSNMLGTNKQRLITANNNWLLGYWGGNKDAMYAEGWVNSGSLADTAVHVYGATGNNGGPTSFYDGGTLLASNNGGITGPNGLSLGAFNNTPSVEGSAGNIAEIVVYDHTLSDADRAAVVSYLNFKWLGSGGGGSAANLLPTGSPVVIGAAAALDLNGVNQAIGGLTGPAGAVVGNSGKTAATLTFDPGSAITTFGGTIRDGMLSGGTGQVALNVRSGTLTLTGSSTYSGSTTINAGKLVVDGLLASLVTVNSGGSLGGTGSLASITVNASGHLGPGNSPGILHLSGNLILLAGAVMDFELDSPGNGYDQLDISGQATLNGTLNVTLFNGFAPSQGQSFDIFNFNGVPIGQFAQLNLPVLSSGLSWNTSSLYTTGEISVVPEPSTLALLGVSMIGLLGWAWRRRQS